MAFNIGIIGPGGIAERKLAPALAEVEEATLWNVAILLETAPLTSG